MEIIDNLLKNNKIVYFICFLLAIYISFIQSRLTDNQIKFFHNDYIRIIYLFIIIFIFNKNSIIGTLLVITYLTMSSSLISEDFYVTEKFLISRVEEIGFNLEARSEINANARDTANHPKGVWSLPPSFAGGEKDKQRYIDIGESDRMTLRFKK